MRQWCCMVRIQTFQRRSFDSIGFCSASSKRTPISELLCKFSLFPRVTFVKAMSHAPAVRGFLVFPDKPLVYLNALGDIFLFDPLMLTIVGERIAMLPYSYYGVSVDVIPGTHTIWYVDNRRESNSSKIVLWNTDTNTTISWTSPRRLPPIYSSLIAATSTFLSFITFQPIKSGESANGWTPSAFRVFRLPLNGFPAHASLEKRYFGKCSAPLQIAAVEDSLFLPATSRENAGNVLLKLQGAH